ncbi:hypothetical protein GOP47_0026430 [Adiantum capillus-veneris]|nr:hypothetical protein GOP47_0026430 [Adiantum capillus-veneris]
MQGKEACLGKKAKMKITVDVMHPKIPLSHPAHASVAPPISLCLLSQHSENLSRIDLPRLSCREERPAMLYTISIALLVKGEGLFNISRYPALPHKQISLAANERCLICSSRPHMAKLLKNEERSKGCSLLVPIISTVDVTIFIVTMFVNNCPQHSDGCILRFLGRLSFQPLRSNPLIGPSSSTLLKMGGLSWVTVAQSHQFWRLLSCLWLHAGLVHLVVNIICLLFIGIKLEQEFGCGRLGSIYFLSGLGGSLYGELFLQRRVSAGASIPLFGLLGAMLSELITNFSRYNSKFAPLTTIILLCLVNLAIGIFPHNDNFSHFWGFLFGLLLGFVFLMEPQQGWNKITPPSTNPEGTSKYKGYQIMLWVGAVILLVAGFIVGVVLAVRGVDGSAHCWWCHYLSCVPSPWWDCDAVESSSERPTCNYVMSGTYMFMRCESNQRSQLYNGIFTASSLKVLCARLCR